MFEEQIRGGFLHLTGHAAVGDDRHRRILPDHQPKRRQRRTILLPSKSQGRCGVHGAGVQGLVFDEEAGPRDMPMDTLQQGGGVEDVVDGHDDQPGCAEKMTIERLAVRGTVAATTTHRSADDHRHGHLAVVDEGEFRALIDDLIGSEGDEVAEHDLHDRPPPGHGESVSEAHQSGLADGRVADTARKPAAETAGDFKGASVLIFQVFPEKHDCRVVLQKIPESRAKPLDHPGSLRRFAHRLPAIASRGEGIGDRRSGVRCHVLFDLAQGGGQRGRLPFADDSGFARLRLSEAFERITSESGSDLFRRAVVVSLRMRPKSIAPGDEHRRLA
jgi:hypothetical protein